MRNPTLGAFLPGARDRQRVQEAGDLLAGSMSRARVLLQREDVGWTRLDGGTQDAVPLQVIKDHSVRARHLAAYNPLVKRGVAIRNAYMWSSMPKYEGLTRAAADRLETPLLGLSARVRDESALCTDGMVLYLVDRARGRVSPVPLKRIVSVARSADATDETDVAAFLVQPVTDDTRATQDPRASEPVWHLVAGHERASIQDPDGYRVARDVAVYASVNRQSGEAWGKPDLMGAVYWARAYKEYLEASYTVSRALARFAFKVSSMSSRQQQAVIAQVSTAATSGGTASLGQGQDLQAVAKSGAGMDFAAGSPLAAMVSAALDVPLSVLLTDGSAGGRQGAESALEEPTFKAFEMRRHLHADLIQRVLRALGHHAVVRLAPLSTELIQRWGQVVTLGYQNGALHQDEMRSLFLERFRPVGAHPVDDLPPTAEDRQQAVGNPGGAGSQGDGRSTGVGPLSDGTNAYRDEDGGETVA